MLKVWGGGDGDGDGGGVSTSCCGPLGNLSRQVTRRALSRCVRHQPLYDTVQTEEGMHTPQIKHMQIKAIN